ncbi:phenoloxidase-activating factor 2-like [Drosophila kikkawai]|uniref:Phenoloxidase-activating factor 2-like n=1 Tax=Drosophila kikkawai TaxID=30033 RepID=A0A6P4HX19_DROKI|nr:phenoloxidase-activating factor 2-like [Drosophila kikkawai]
MLQFRGLVLILCLVLASSCVQAGDFGIVPDDRTSKSPWLVSVKESCGSSIGGGSLISKFVVLTSWVVIAYRNASELVVRIENSPSLMEVRVRSVVRHPNFNVTTGVNNLGLLILKKSIEFNNKIAPINLAARSSMRILDLSSCFAESSYKKTLPLPVVQTATCEQELRRWLVFSFPLDDSLLCAGGRIGIWESGYPLVCPLASEPSRFQQVGIINWHRNSGDNSTFDVYTNVVRLSGWIFRKVIQHSYVEDPEGNEEEIKCPDGEIADFFYFGRRERAN